MSAASNTSRRLELFHFGPDGRELLGCHHVPASGSSDTGVVLCYPLGHEYLQFHRVFRQLSIMLAEAGVHVFRFDYLGCGDSSGGPEDWRLARWIEDIGSAVDELERRTGVKKLGLAGMRLGASLAARVAAARPSIDSVVLWDPIRSGADYLDELKKLHAGMLRYAHVLPRPGGPDGLEILGFPINEALIAELGDFDLDSIDASPGKRVLVIESNDSVEQGPLTERLKGLGAEVQRESFSNPHLWVWTEDFGKMHVPHQILRTIVSWTTGGEA